MAFVVVTSLVAILEYSISSKSKDSSVLIAILYIVFTASTGYLPAAVSPDNIIQLLPSIIAFAMSVTSALVGLGFLIMESNICVAVITGFPAIFDFFIRSFCTIGISSAFTSTPRSPLATMIPSEAASISSILSTPS